MKIKSMAKYVRVSPTKARPFARRLRGVSLEEALGATRYAPQKVSAAIGKVLKAAMADAVNNHKRAVEDFRVAEVIVQRGPVIKRFWPRSRGMVRPVRKPMSHIQVVLDDGRGEEK